jgi:uncharacterized protein (DUF433 family)
MELIDVGLYTFREASRFTSAEPREIRRWLRGYTFKFKGEARYSPPLWKTQLDYPEELGFRDLLELRFVKHFVKCGVHLTVVRKALQHAREIFGTEYPFTAHRFLTDGKRVFHEALESVAAEHEGPLTDVIAHQLVLDSVIRPSLYAGIEYRHDRKSAARWYPMPRTRAVVLDPAIGFGKPILSEYGIPIDTIAAAVATEKSAARVARIFDIPRSAVTVALKFEQRLAA